MITTDDMRTQFDKDGYLVLDDVFDPAVVLSPIFGAYQRVLDGICEHLYNMGEISDPLRELSFLDRLIAVTRESGRKLHQAFEISLPYMDSVRPDTPICDDAALFNLLAHPGILDIIEGFIGSEIELNPISHVRIKLPASAKKPEWEVDGTIAKVPWHQDNSTMEPNADETSVVTVWIPLNPASVANGCLEVVPGSHKAGLLQHCPAPDGANVPEKLFAADRGNPVPMDRGVSCSCTSGRYIADSKTRPTERESHSTRAIRLLDSQPDVLHIPRSCSAVLVTSGPYRLRGLGPTAGQAHGTAPSGAARSAAATLPVAGGLARRHCVRDVRHT